jgi:hypothetical protein
MAISSVLQGLLYSYYSSDRGFPDGLLYSCNRTKDGYVLFDFPTPFSGISPACSSKPSPSFYPISYLQLSLNLSSANLYPVYKTHSVLILSNQSGTSGPISNRVAFPAEIYGESSVLDPLLESDLVSGVLPTAQTGSYEAAIPDSLARLYGLKVGDNFTIEGVALDMPLSFPIPPVIFTKVVVVVGIFSKSMVDMQLNIHGISVFSASDWGMTASNLSITPGLVCPTITPGYAFANMTYRTWIPPLQDYCHQWPFHFGIFSKNLLRDLYNSDLLSPSEVLFNFKSLPPTYSDLVRSISQVQDEIGPSYYVSLLWRSNIALIDGAERQFVFSDTRQIANASLSPSCSSPLPCYFETGVQVSPIIGDLETIAAQSYALTVVGFFMAVVIEPAVFVSSSKKFLKETEAYKSVGISSGRTLRLLLNYHFAFPAKLVAGTTGIVTVIGFALNIVSIPAMGLGGAFIALLFLEFAVLVRRAFSRREVSRFAEKLG